MLKGKNNKTNYNELGKCEYNALSKCYSTQDLIQIPIVKLTLQLMKHSYSAHHDIQLYSFLTFSLLSFLPPPNNYYCN